MPKKVTKLYSYVVEHDRGFAPNPTGGYCTLAKCMFSKSSRKNMLEMAEEGDWIVGTGGADLKRSAGNGKMIYAMRVDKKIPLASFFKQFAGRTDARRDCATARRFALVSKHFYYFGRNARDISEIPMRHLKGQRFEKKGPRYVCKRFSENFIRDFASWLSQFKVGKRGEPCWPINDDDPECPKLKCPPKPKCSRRKP